jgi:hypothetical protein
MKFRAIFYHLLRPEFLFSIGDEFSEGLSSDAFSNFGFKSREYNQKILNASKDLFARAREFGETQTLSDSEGHVAFVQKLHSQGNLERNNNNNNNEHANRSEFEIFGNCLAKIQTTKAEDDLLGGNDCQSDQEAN